MTGGKREGAGRPLGVPNKSTVEIRELIQSFVENNINSLQYDFDQLTGAEKFRALERFIQYVLPKPATENIITTLPDARGLPAWMDEPNSE